MTDSTALRPERPARSLWITGALLLLPALYFGWRYPIFGNADRLVDIGKLAGYGIPELIFYLGGLAALTAGYLRSIHLLRGRDFAAVRRPVFGISAVLLLAFAALYPVNAIDLFIYAVRSYLLTEYGANPNAVEPEWYWEHDDFVHFASREWADNVSPYGPLWNLIASPATLLGGDRILIALLIFKVLVIVSAVATARLIYDAVGHDRPGDATAAAVAYLWNPLLLWEGIGNGHNDVIVMLPVVAAVWCWRGGHDRWVIPLLVGSALIKYVTILLLPTALLMLWRRYPTWPARLRLAVWSGSASLLLVYVALYPFFGLGALRESIASQTGIFLTSLGAALVQVDNRFEWAFQTSLWTQRVGYSLLAIVVVVLLSLTWRNRIRFERALFEAMFALLLVATWNFRPWYLIWLVALVALVPIGWPLWRTTTWTVSALLSYVHYIWVREWWPWDGFTFSLTGIAIAFLPVVLVTLAEALTAPWRARRALTPALTRHPETKVRGPSYEGRESF